MSCRTKPTSTHVHKYECVYITWLTCTYIYMCNVCTHVHIYIHNTYIYIYTSTSTSTSIIYIYIYTHNIYTYIHIYIYIFIYLLHIDKCIDISKFPPIWDLPRPTPPGAAPGSAAAPSPPPGRCGPRPAPGPRCGAPAASWWCLGNSGGTGNPSWKWRKFSWEWRKI